MKKLITISAIVMSGLVCNTANAQIRIGIHIFPHIILAPRPVVVRAGAPVYREPVVSDSDDCDFYYLPDVGAYYSVAEQCYYYQDGDNWISAVYLPGVYRDYDWRYAARRFEIRESRPYLHNDIYRSRYQGGDYNIARNHDHFRAGFDYHNYGNNDQHFDKRGGFARNQDNRGGNNGQHFNNRADNSQRVGSNNHYTDNYNKNNGQTNAGNSRGNNHGQQGDQNHDRNNNQNRDRGNRDNQPRLAQNSSAYGHVNGKRDRF